MTKDQTPSREEVIRWAREAGLPSDELYHPNLERFAALVAAAEREACAKVCEEYTDNEGGKFVDHEGHGYECATAIRAKGETK